MTPKSVKPQPIQNTEGFLVSEKKKLIKEILATNELLKAKLQAQKYLELINSKKEDKFHVEDSYGTIVKL